MLTALLAGAAGGTLLGRLGLRRTRFESNSEGRFYTMRERSLHVLVE